MKNFLKSILIGLLFVATPVMASSVLQIFQGGTATSSVPTQGQFLVGNGSNTYLYDNVSNYATSGQLTSYVPYTDATGNVDLNAKQLFNVFKIGIGTSSPDSLLQVATTGQAINVGTGANAATFISLAGGRSTVGYDGNNSYLKGSTGKAVSIISNGASSPQIVASSNSLNVGIGGAISDTATLTGSTMIVQGDGRVAIGTTSPDTGVNLETWSTGAGGSNSTGNIIQATWQSTQFGEYYTRMSASGFDDTSNQSLTFSNGGALAITLNQTGSTYRTNNATTLVMNGSNAGNNNIGIGAGFGASTGADNPSQLLTLWQGGNYATNMSIPATPTIASSTSGGSLTAGSYFFQISASDGVGTTTPSSQVFASTTGSTGSITLSNYAVTGAGSYNIHYGTTTNQKIYYFSTTTTTFVFATTTGNSRGTTTTQTTALVNKISSAGNSWFDAGNVGIGTTSPQYGLDVETGSIKINNNKQGTGQTATLFLADGSISKAYGGAMTIAGGTKFTGGEQNDQTSISPNGAQLDTSATFAIYSYALTGINLTGYGLKVAAPTNASSTFAAIFTGGFVGIGTTTPDALLQVATSTANATTTVEWGKVGQTKGTCQIWYDAGGTVKYVYIAAGATSFTITNSSTACK